MCATSDSVLDYNLTVTKLKFIWNKCKNNKIMKIGSSSRIFKAICHNYCYLEDGKWQAFGTRQE